MRLTSKVHFRFLSDDYFPRVLFKSIGSWNFCFANWQRNMRTQTGNSIISYLSLWSALIKSNQWNSSKCNSLHREHLKVKVKIYFQTKGQAIKERPDKKFKTQKGCQWRRGCFSAGNLKWDIENKVWKNRKRAAPKTSERQDGNSNEF